jgi:hypothetical protein
MAMKIDVERLLPVNENFCCSDGRISFAGLVCQACMSIQSLILGGELDILSTLR